MRSLAMIVAGLAATMMFVSCEPKDDDPTPNPDGGGGGNIVNATGEAWVFENDYGWGEAYIFYADQSFESYILNEGVWGQAAGIPREVGTYETDGNTLSFFAAGQPLWTRTYSVSGKTLTMTDDFGSTEYSAQPFNANDDGENDDDGGDASGWPDNALLAEYGLDGMTVPEGATNIEYYEATVGGSVLTINFNATGATDMGLTTWLIGNGWTQTDSTSLHDEYAKTGFTAIYARTDDGGNRRTFQSIKD